MSLAARVVVRWGRVEGAGADVEALNSADRIDGPVTDDDRRCMVAARLLLARAVASATGADPRDVVLVQRCPRCGGPHGLPRVEVQGSRVPHVSMAHAGSLAVVALASRPVGIDVEPGDAFAWTRVEAALKATGHGLDVDPAAVAVADGRVVRWDGPGRRPRLRLRDVAVAGHAISVARLGARQLVLEVAEDDLTRR